MNSNVCVIDEKCSKKRQRKDALGAPPSRRLYNSSLSNITEDWFIDNLFIKAKLGRRMALSYISPLNVRRGVDPLKSLYWLLVHYHRPTHLEWRTKTCYIMKYHKNC